MKFTKAAAWIAALSLCAGAMTLPVTAAGEGEPDNQSDAQVSFVVDPLNPNSLRLDKLPDFNFGSQHISYEDERYYIDTQQTALELQVVDLRGTGKGWNVTAKIEEPLAIRTENQEGVTAVDSLKGARICIGDGDVSYAGNSSVVGDLKAPKHMGRVDENGDVTIRLANSGENTGLIFNAVEEAGRGRWSDKLLTVYLEVPGGSAKLGNYTGTVLWTLSDTPAD